MNKYTHTYMHTRRHTHTHTHTHITIMFEVVWFQNNIHQRLWHINSVLFLEGLFFIWCIARHNEVRVIIRPADITGS
jgi:hypothetical protein